MEAQTDIQMYVERGKQQLAQGHGREAAIAFANAAQLNRTDPEIHLGLASANLALGDYNTVRDACQVVMQLQPAVDGAEHRIAQALIDLLDKRYQDALEQVNQAIEQKPGVGYMYALRAYLLRATGQDYDAGLERARAARFSGGGRYENCFPPLEQKGSSDYKTGYGASPEPDNGYTPAVNGKVDQGPRPWAERNPMERQVQRRMIRARSVMGRYPAIVTYILIGLNFAIFLLGFILPQVPIGGQSIPFLYYYGAQINFLVLHGGIFPFPEVWRIFTAMFLHQNIIHVGLNMLSLFFIGPTIEILYGKWRYLAIYLLSGIAGGLLFLALDPVNGAAVGASGAIFGVFGAMGTFFFVNRNSLMGRGFLGNWIFWLGLNLVWGFTPGSSIAIWGHIGGLIAGLILGYLLMPRPRNRII